MAKHPSDGDPFVSPYPGASARPLDTSRPGDWARSEQARFESRNGRGAPQIDMTLEGEFRQPPVAPLLNKLIGWAVLVALLAGGLALAALAFWLALILIPVMIVAGLLGWAGLRYKLWRMGAGFGGQAR